MVDARHWLALARSPGGRATLGALLQQLGTPEALFTAPERRLRAAGLRDDAVAWLTAPDAARLDADLRFLAESGTVLVPWGSPHYPTLLAASPDAPLLLFVRGDPALLAAPQLAVVGSRNPTSNGARDAAAFAAELCRAGLVITSGLARGIDGEAHRGALAGGGRTIAVCATGLDRVFPASHRALAREIVERGGALVSEFPPGAQALRHHFVERNRIIAGLALGTLVVEAAAQSGSLITARYALEAGREVFAIPGSIHSPLSKGCHRLIRDGAKLVETARDVVEELGALAELVLAPATRQRERDDAPRDAAAAAPDALPDEEGARVLHEVGWEPTPFDLIVQRSGLPTPVVSSALLMLELQGRVSAAAGGRYSRITPPEGSR